MNYNNFLENEAFKNVNGSTLSKIDNLSNKIKDKTPADAIMEIMNFSNEIKNDENFSLDERNALGEAIFSSLSKKDREKLAELMEIVNNFR